MKWFKAMNESMDKTREKMELLSIELDKLITRQECSLGLVVAVSDVD